MTLLKPRILRKQSFLWLYLHPTPNQSSILQDIETFETVLAQYSTNFHGHTNNKALNSLQSGFNEDLRGHLIVVNEDNGEVLAQVDPLTFSLKEDPQLHQQGHENDAVLIE
ncbi:hypothetical protein H0H93_013006, partial [Arthromyces matolae]